MLRGWVGWVKAISYLGTIAYPLFGGAWIAEPHRIGSGLGCVMRQTPEKRGVASGGMREEKVRLMEVVRGRIRARHYSLRTEQAYLGWIRQFILSNGRRHPCELGGAEVEAFLSRLATERQVAASTQNQALSALLFLYREVLRVELPWMDSVLRAKRPRRLPTGDVRGRWIYHFLGRWAVVAGRGQPPPCFRSRREAMRSASRVGSGSR